jgi:hypothetical protein
MYQEYHDNGHRRYQRDYYDPQAEYYEPAVQFCDQRDEFEYSDDESYVPMILGVNLALFFGG